MSNVHLTIERVDVTNMLMPGEILLDLVETDETVLARATAWATVRGYTSIIQSLEDTIRGPNEAGWSAVINKPNALAILATWPWCKEPRSLPYLFGERMRHRGEL